LGTEYLTLALEIERLFPGFVDAYMGPAALRTRANSGEEPDPAALLDRARRLLTDILISDYDKNRKEYLRAQVTGIIMTCRKLAGEVVPYLDEVRDSFDIEVDYTPDTFLDQALADFDGVLPGSGDVRERNVAYRARFIVDQATAGHLIDLLLAETRLHTEQFVDLPAQESVEIDFVSDQPWSGYNWYLGNGRSRVEINTDLPINALDLPSLVAHEAYPGHHTEHSLKEIGLFHGRGCAEHAIQLINTPECLVSEGIAVLAEQFAFGNQQAEWMANVLMPAAGLALDAETHARIQQASTHLRGVSANAAMRFHQQGQSEREVVQYLAHYGMATDAEAAKRFSFIADPLWRAYTFTYSTGRVLLEAWLDAGAGDDRQTRYARVLSEQITPSQIARLSATG
jgi:hypothetical protein